MWLGTQHLFARGEDAAEAVLAAAPAAGVTWLDTADVYGVENFLGPRLGRLRVATKVGLVRDGARFRPDGRADALERAVDGCLARLGRIDRLQWHAPDPKVPLARSAKALRRVLDDGRVGALGVCNVRVGELRALAGELPLASVQVEVSRAERAVVRSGVVEVAKALGVPVLGWRPLGGRDGVVRALEHAAVREVAARRGAPAAGVVLAWLRTFGVEPVAATTSVEHLREWAPVELDADDLAALDVGTEAGAQWRTLRAARRPPPGGPEVVLIGGTPAAGKSTLARRWPDHVRLNRDTVGGTLQGLLRPLDEAVRSGRDVILDNTYPQRAQRNAVIETAWAAGGRVRCVWLDTPDGEAERNAVRRMLDAEGALLGGDALSEANQRDAAVIPPRALHRFREDLEAPEVDEGFESVEVLPFVRAPAEGRPGIRCRPEHLSPLHPAVRAAADDGHAVIVTEWAPGADPVARRTELEARAVAAGVTAFAEVCVHPAGPPVCWCREPLPGLLLAAADRAGADPSRVVVLASTPSDEALARRLGLSAVPATADATRRRPRPTPR